MALLKPWPDCRCPLSIGHQNTPYDKKPFPHSCGLSKDEPLRHYICDHETYLILSKAKPNTLMGKWVAKRCQERRLYVIRGPPRPTVKKPPIWKVEEVDMNAIQLAPGWKRWTPDLAEFIIHKRNIEGLFAWLGVVERWRLEEMMSAGVGFLLACGFSPEKVNRSALFKCDRVYVTGSHDFYQCMQRVWMKINHFLYEVELGPGHIGPKMGYMKRLSDIESDARVLIGGCGHI